MAGALIELLAHVLAGGSIYARFVPAISVGRRVDHDTIVGVFKAVGVDAQQRHADSDGRATELPGDRCIRPRTVSRRDGRPKVTKADLDAVPAVVWESPTPVRRRFVESYVAHRGVHFENESNDAYPGGTPGVVSRRSPRPDRRVRYQHRLTRGPVDSRFLQTPLANLGCN